ncbi:hypothetical protein F4604DRAFT_1690785 [Suillus subluteus]|nr:hypothetical protein F4604DRAFT_1690785 [Suillus subluteus]
MPQNGRLECLAAFLPQGAGFFFGGVEVSASGISAPPTSLALGLERMALGIVGGMSMGGRFAREGGNNSKSDSGVKLASENNRIIGHALDIRRLNVHGVTVISPDSPHTIFPTL